ncbi:PREDICTED: uncharacterized protein LOC104827699 [Tarenaya hassleriana]|uniref:uncharacterized protein LOC104827699 n=1 Tax=Tarenaya hassleriana TaxID=28532 RepID=UPI00053C6878|nr:PREDICTED: uncharacterized protein LOC104827699 [Tarenaya hassleriana]
MVISQSVGHGDPEPADSSDTPRFTDDLGSACSTPFVSAPSSPGRDPSPGYFFSAPASPMHFVLYSAPSSAARAASEYPQLHGPIRLPPSGNPTNGIAKRRGLQPSAHELHYTANRAQAEEMKKRTYLPYRHGLFGCLGFSSKSYSALNGLARSLNPVSSR